MLLIAKMCKKSDAYNNIIYLLLVGYPLVIFSFIKYYKKKENDIKIKLNRKRKL